MEKQKTLWKSKNNKKELGIELIKGFMFGFIKVPGEKIDSYALALGIIVFTLDIRKRETYVKY